MRRKLHRLFHMDDTDLRENTSVPCVNGHTLDISPRRLTTTGMPHATDDVGYDDTQFEIHHGIDIVIGSEAMGQFSIVNRCDGKNGILSCPYNATDRNAMRSGPRQALSNTCVAPNHLHLTTSYLLNVCNSLSFQRCFFSSSCQHPTQLADFTPPGTFEFFKRGFLNTAPAYGDRNTVKKQPRTQ